MDSKSNYFFLGRQFEHLLKLDQNRKIIIPNSNISNASKFDVLLQQFDRLYDKIDSSANSIKKSWKVPILYAEKNNKFLIFCIFKLYYDTTDKIIHINIYFEDFYTENYNFLQLSYDSNDDILHLDELNFSFTQKHQQYITRFTKKNGNVKFKIGKFGMSIFNHFEFLLKPKTSQLYDQSFITYRDHQLPLYKLNLLTDDSYYTKYGFIYDEEFYKYFTKIRKTDFMTFLQKYDKLFNKYNYIFNKLNKNNQILITPGDGLSIQEFFSQYINLSEKNSKRGIKEFQRFLNWFYYQILLNYKKMKEKNQQEFYLPKNAEFENYALKLIKHNNNNKSIENKSSGFCF